VFTVTQRQTINRPVAEVFDFLAHFENRPRFESAVVEARLTADGAPGHGARYREVRKVMGGSSVPSPRKNALKRILEAPG